MVGTLLLVEDDPLIRRWLTSRLSAAGHRVVEAESVAAARALISSSPFDVVLLDYRLPDGTGFDLMPEIEARLPGVPILMLTVHGTVEHAVEAMRRGAFNYVQKPIDPAQLDAHIAKALETGELRKENRRLR